MFGFIVLISTTCPAQLLQRGLTPFDVKFFQGQAAGFNMFDADETDTEETPSSKRSRKV